MLYINLQKPGFLVEDVDALFSTLTYADVMRYKSLINKTGAFISVVNNPVGSMSVKHVVINTCYGECMLSDISTSIKILILAARAIDMKQCICFIAGEIGDNFLKDLYLMCADTDYVSLYQPDGIIPQISSDVQLSCKG